MNQQTLIDLRTFSKGDDFPAYAALYCPTSYSNQTESIPMEALFCLTPHIMQWSENIWLFDLRQSENFWRLQQQKLNQDLFQILQSVLEHCFGQKILVVFSHHPWPAIFFLDYLCHQQAELHSFKESSQDSSKPHSEQCSELRWGAYSLESSMSQNLYENITWEHWFSPLKILAEKWEAVNVKGFNGGRFRSQQAQLKRFIERMELWGPYDLSLAKVGSLKGEIERRYSVWLARVWHWTFARFQDSQASAHNRSYQELDFFPWQAYQTADIPSVKRLLEYPVSQWEVVEPLLKEDLLRLCELPSWTAAERVQRMEWNITLFNWQELKIELSFRNPYHLHKEQPEFTTALYQAYYAYHDVMKQLQQRDSDLDLPSHMPFLSWRLAIRERLFLTPAIMELFSDDWDKHMSQDILELQNKLPIGIESYQIHPDFCSEQMFQSQQVGEPAAPAYTFSLQQWQVCLPRPLFYYKQPQPMVLNAGDEPLFLERTSNNWWENNSLDNLVKDYFMLKEAQGQIWWVYKNSRGEWFKHGIYS